MNYKREYNPWNKGLTKETDERVKKLADSKIGKSRLDMIGNKFALGNMPNQTSFKKGKYHPMWKEGKYIASNGYILIYQPNHPFAQKTRGYVLEHRLVMEQYLGRYLTREEVVHHLDFDHSNNLIENLELFENQRAHLDYHGMLRHFVREALTWPQ